MDEGRHPWEGSVDALLCNPNGDAAERWTRKVARNGVVEFNFPLTSSATTGEWHITVSFSDSSKSLAFYVLSGQKSSAILTLRPDMATVAWTDTLYGSAVVTDMESDQPLEGSFVLTGKAVSGIDYLYWLSESGKVEDLSRDLPVIMERDLNVRNV